jgi:nucleotide-binding universal stress UspA family protein
MEFQKILVPLDGSDLAERVLLAAVRLAEGMGATLVLLTVVSPLPHRDAPDPVSQMVQSHAYEAGLYLKEIRSRLQPTTVTIETAVLPGNNPANTIITYAKAQGINLILMTTHGRSGLTRWTFGRVAEKVLRRAPCPTILLRSHQEIAPDQIKRILVPLDGSSLAEQVLGPTRRITEALDADLYLLRVIEPSPFSLIRDDGDKADEMVEELTYLEAVRTRLASANLRVQAEVRRGSAADAIIEYAEEKGVDLIVLSSLGSSGLQLWVFGSVAERVMIGAGRATLLFRHEA